MIHELRLPQRIACLDVRSDSDRKGVRVINDNWSDVEADESR